jgi:prepilin signal peptidase PulO-like enzyme (type II secretory pathway)
VQLFLIYDLVLLSVVDLELWLIPWECTLPWVPIGFIVAVIFPELHAHATAWTQNRYADGLIDCFSGVVLGAGALWSIGFLTTLFTFVYYRVMKRSDRPKEGMGGGDVHLMAMIGAMLGWKPVLATLFLAVFIGSFTGVAKILWEKLKKWRLKDQYRAWQPTYEISDEEVAYVPKFWPLLVFGVIVVVAASWMIYHCQNAFASNSIQIFSTLEEYQSVKKVMLTPSKIDVRLIPAVMLMMVGVLLILAYPFYSFLKKRDLLPQGSIVVKESGEKEEIMEGNYVPFGPSLALAALVVVFYDPLLRSAAWWFYNGSHSQIVPPAFHVVGEEHVTALLNSIGEFFKWMTQAAGGA